MADSFVNIPGVTTWKAPVANLAALPASGNRAGDARVTLDTQQIYIWSGSAWILASGTTVNSFTTFQTPAGTYPVADSSTDTMTFTSSNSSLTITGNSSTDTIDFILGSVGSDTQIIYNDGGVLAGDANHTWNKTTKLNTLTNSTLTTTPTTILLARNATAATVNNQKTSPSIEVEGQGWKTTSTAGSQSVKVRQYVLPVQGTTNPRGSWNLDTSINAGAYTNILNILTGDASTPTTPIMNFPGRANITYNQSNFTPSTVDILNLNNTGTYTNFNFTYSGTVKQSITGQNNAGMIFRTTNNGTYEFYNGSSIGAQTQRAQIYSGGFYTSYNGYFGQTVTAGNPDTSVQTTLSTYGSFAGKGILVQSSTYTLTQNETFVYVDPGNTNVCLGTPNPCSTYDSSEGTCNSHSAVGCSWYPGTTCNEFSGTDSGTCGSHTGCTWDQTGCGGANNTDESTCTNQNSPYGGSCAWDTTTCPGIMVSGTCMATSGCTWNDPCTGQPDQGTCESFGCTWNSSPCNTFDGTNQSDCESGHTGCTWTSGDCHAFDNTTQSDCETGHTGCTWSADPCDVYNHTNAPTCTVNVGCSWAFSPCSDFDNTNELTCETDNPNCTWAYEDCGTIVVMGDCNAQAGCNWSGGVCVSDCATYNGTDQATCEANPGCSWDGATTCYGGFNPLCTANCNLLDLTDEATCQAQAGCTWDAGTSTCNGGYNDDCTGTYNKLCSGTYDSGGSCAGVYDTSCTGGYCTGNICQGTYGTGTCSGNYGYYCQGSASCSVLNTSGSCAAEVGCTWTAGITLTLPSNSNANRANTGRFYSIMHVGDTGNVVIKGQTGEPIFQYTELFLFKKGDKVMLHNQAITYSCSARINQPACEAQVGCTWHPITVCAGTSDQSSCEAKEGCTWDSSVCSAQGDSSSCNAITGCSWDGFSCTGNSCNGSGNASTYCSGSYTDGSKWYAHSLERGLNYVAKTANYTVTAIDDVVDCTSNSFTLTLPSASLNNNKTYVLKNTGTGLITIATTGAQTIDGLGTQTMAQYTSLTVFSNGSNWVVV